MRYILILWLSLWLVSCNQKNFLCNTYRPVPVEGWEANDTLTIALDTVRLHGEYSLEVGVRSTRLYPYKYLYLLAEITLSNPDTAMVDTIVCEITDTKGNFQGNGLSIYGKVFPVSNINMLKGQYGEIKIRHIMRRDPLPGLSDIGVLVSAR